MVFRHGHHPRTRANLREPYLGPTRVGISTDRVAPLVDFLVRRYGFRGACRLMGWDHGYLARLRGGRIKRVMPATAHRITQTVLAHRGYHRTMFDEDVTPRLPLPEERVAADRQMWREERRRQRAERRSA